MSALDYATKPEVYPALETSTEDDPRVLADAATEDYSLHVVPKSWRMPKGNLAYAWFGVATAFFYYYFAAFIAFAYGTVNALIGMGLAVLVYSLINAVVVRTSSQNGLSVALFSRGTLGYFGASIATLVLAATAIYYIVFEGSVVAVAAQSYIGGPIQLWYAVVTCACAPLAWKGVSARIDKLNGFLLPVFLIGTLAMLVWVFADKGFHGFLGGTAAAPGTQLPWLQSMAAYMGIFVLMMYTMDFARLSKPRDERFHIGITFGFGYYLFTFVVNALIGIALVSALGLNFAELAGRESALPAGVIDITGLFGLLLIAITQFRINMVSMYVASSNLESFFARALRIKLPRTAWLVVVVAICFLLMLINVFSYVNDALAYQGIAIVAWVGVMLAQVGYLRARGIPLSRQEFRPGRIPAINPGGIVAWGLATGLGLYLKLSASATSQFFATWGLIITLVVAAGLYLLSLAVARQSWFTLDRPGDPQNEVDDVWETRIRCHACDRFYIAREMDRDPSAEHKAICAACATAPHVYLAARAEARQA